MKQNLQPPATPLEMLSLFFPAGLLDYFDLKNHVSQETCFFFFLEEKPSIPQEHSIYIYIPEFLPGKIEAQDFPVRGKAVYLRIKRRRWEDPETGQLIVVIETY